MPARGLQRCIKAPSLLGDILSQLGELGVATNGSPDVICSSPQFPGAAAMDDQHPCLANEGGGCGWTPNPTAPFHLSEAGRISEWARSLASAYQMLYQEALCKTAECFVRADMLLATFVDYEEEFTLPVTDRIVVAVLAESIRQEFSTRNRAVGFAVDVDHAPCGSANAPAGRQQASVSPRNERTTIGYDAAGQQTSIRNPLGFLTTSVYDSVRQLHAVQDSCGVRCIYTCDNLSQRASMATAVGASRC
jgi:YD repeat-containing protein